ncbi:MAG: VIT domain-containing protein [candidate division WOR-3 bacterium]
MIQAKAAPVLEVEGGGLVPLVGVAVKSRILGLVSEVTVEQRYRNDEKQNVEVVYTFPLPLKATLLGMQAKIGERVLHGQVVERPTAEQSYEEAIDEGDTPVVLVEASPGVYTMNLGNLLPGETATISFTYAQVHCWQGDTLRVVFPTVIGPRYGNAEAAGLQPHEEPVTDLLVDHQFTVDVEVVGMLQQAAVESPQHRIVVKRTDAATIITLADGRASMDRDFVLVFRLTGAERACALCDGDFEGYTAIAIFNPVVPREENPAPRGIKILLDCSGSMQGDSIEQARSALALILDAIRPQDYFNIVTFGNTHHVLFKRMRRATPAALAAARRHIGQVTATMGGTEIGRALRRLYQIPYYASKAGESLPGKNAQDVLVITDGDIWGSEEVIAEAKASGHRLFTIGVGSAAAEHAVVGLAEATGGAGEIVSPNEDMAERIRRHFERIYLTQAVGVDVTWPSTPTHEYTEKPTTVFSGDTVVFAARFAQQPKGRVTMTLRLGNGTTLEQSTEVEEVRSESRPGTLTRLAAASELRQMLARCSDKGSEVSPPEVRRLIKKATRLAVRYQLVSPHTCYMMVLARSEGEKATAAPVLRQVPQMLAAGWGGVGTVSCVMARRKLDGALSFQQILADFLSDNQSIWLREQVPSAHIGKRPPSLELINFCRRINALHSQATTFQVRTINELENLGLPRRIGQQLAALVDRGLDEETVVALFVAALADEPAGIRLSLRLREMIHRLIAPRARAAEQSCPDILEHIRMVATQFATGFNAFSQDEPEPDTMDLR